VTAESTSQVSPRVGSTPSVVVPHKYHTQYQNPSSTFWESGSNLPPPYFNDEDIFIAVMGMTGAGKSSFISNVAGVDLRVGHGLSACRIPVTSPISKV
jgi:predicted GTPase